MGLKRRIFRVERIMLSFPPFLSDVAFLNKVQQCTQFCSRTLLTNVPKFLEKILFTRRTESSFLSEFLFDSVRR
jgi:hypothetical protein